MRIAMVAGLEWIKREKYLRIEIKKPEQVGLLNSYFL
jgi:hypothetical protein